MRVTRLFLFAALLAAATVQGAVKLTALQIISTDANGKIQGVGAHRFRTTQHGGQPCIFLIKDGDPTGAIINGPGPTQNGISIPLTAGTHTYTVLAEKANSYNWNHYSIQFFFDLSNNPQISALAPYNTTSTLFFPPHTANSEFTETLDGYHVKAPGTLVYKSGQTEVKLTRFHFSQPELYNVDRVSPFEVRANRTLDYVGEFTLEVTAPPEIAAGGVVNGASFVPKLAPGSLFSIFGSSLALNTQSAAALPLSNNLGGASVTIGGKQAPLVYVSPTQINAQVPYETPVGQNVPVVVTVNGTASPAVNVTVSNAAPGIFQFGQKRAVVQNADYTVNNTDNPAAANSYVIAYLTGSGPVDNPVPSGAAAPAEPLARPQGPVTATIADMPADVAFGGLTPSFVGLMQVNLKVPNLQPGTYPLVITVNGEKSNAAMVTIQ
ncbi:MAG TPA: IPT/TIG domain-containing protein [Bryobacteraceae bacterium]|nr:IPT/TIG domain-containing protein [Bryobacteraceae bacterium]